MAQAHGVLEQLAEVVQTFAHEGSDPEIERDGRGFRLTHLSHQARERMSSSDVNNDKCSWPVFILLGQHYVPNTQTHRTHLATHRYTHAHTPTLVHPPACIHDKKQHHALDPQRGNLPRRVARKQVEAARTCRTLRRARSPAGREDRGICMCVRQSVIAWASERE